MLLFFIAGLAVLVLGDVATASLYKNNFAAQFGNQPAPFKIDVDPKFMAQTKLKASLTRDVLDLDVPDWFDGPPVHNVTTIRDYWVNHYDWDLIQDDLNRNLTQFTTMVNATGSNYTSPVPLHFIHHRSPRSDAIPLLFLHGWPGSFIEVAPIIEGLTNPPGSEQAFHVVAPSIPGFGFSPAPTSTGFNFRAAAASFNALMLQLNYTKYVVQGGDLGAYISHFIAGDFPDSVVSVHSNFWLVSPNATDVARLLNGTATDDEVTTITNLQNFEHHLSGFTYVHSIMPLQVALPLSDSPVGYALWVYVLMYYGSDNYNWSAEEIITWSLMHYIQGPFGAIRFYKEGYLVRGLSHLFDCFF